MAQRGAKHRTLHEAAHKADREVDADERQRAGGRPRQKRIYHESAHKLGYWAPPADDGRGEDSEEARRRFEELADYHRDVIAGAGKAVLALGALGVVYGDIGTSPLYTEQAIFTNYHATTHVSPLAVFGAASLIFWALTIVVSLKYAGFIMRAHNRGDGGIMALTALVQRRRIPHAAVLIVLGIFGAGLFFGDGMITPAISVISSVEGLETVSSSFSHLVVPLALVILVGLFDVQRHGTNAVGWLFGPVILLFFVVIGLLGLKEIVAQPGVLQALSPSWAVRFMAN